MSNEQEARELLEEKAKQALFEILEYWGNENVPEPSYAVDRQQIIEHAIATLTAQRDKAVEALRPYKRLAEIVEKALVEDEPPARMKLKSGEIITGEPAEIFESLALTVLEVGKQAAAVVMEIDGK